ncbi:aminoacyl-tRNA deacylase [Kineococcus esterisolvens]|uniref:aminoacyl-tRNA deacylase n=1 Tax=unclassified Kineococcus TaxID=2621656 RepID=UPI003D7F019C
MRWTTAGRAPAAGDLLVAPPQQEPAPPQPPPPAPSTTAAAPAHPADVHPAVAATARALAELDAGGQVVLLPPGPRTAADVAHHLGVPAAAVVRSTLLRAPGDRLVLVLASGAHELFPPSLAAVLGVPHLEEVLEAETVRRTGSVLGSTSPVGLADPLPTYVDVTLAVHPVVWVPAGHPRAVFPTRYDELLRLAGAHPVETG